MENISSIEEEVLDRLIQKLKADSKVPPGLVSHLEQLRREGGLGQPEKLLEAYRQEVTGDGAN